jgi:spermidine synthase
MQPFETLDSFTTPDGQRLTLHRRDGDYFIDLDGHELMSTRVHGSETALGKLACAHLRRAKQARVLIGGLGLGFTLKAALESLPDDAEVVQAEMFPVIVEWHRQHLQSLAVPLDDTRVRMHIGDVAELIRRHNGPPYNAILLDTDNGPDAMCIGSNASLYDETGIELIKEALQPGGILAVWSAHADPAFSKRLRRSGFKVSTETVRGHRRKGPRHTIFVAVR